MLRFNRIFAMESLPMRRPILWLATLLLLTPALTARAAELLTVTIDKIRVLRLKSDASTVVVARPEIVNVVLESPRLVFVYGLTPGETSLHIFDNEEKEVYTADLVVAAKTARQVSVHRGVAETTLSCAPNCMRVATPGAATGGGGGAATSPAAPAAAAASAAAGLGGGGVAPPPPTTPPPAPTTPPAIGSGTGTTTR
jgi:hypothetical protein